MASRAQWQKRVAQWKKSGLKAEDFAAQEGLNPRTLRWWSSRLGRSSAGKAEVDFARLVSVEMAPPRANEPGALEIVLVSGRVVRVRPGFDRAVLRDVLSVLEAS
jgi:hypothetical protein